MLITRDLPSEQEQHELNWMALAKEISQAQDNILQDTSKQSQVPGELIIIGSGIQSLGFIRGEENLIKQADAVFYCVADPGTVAWIKTLRPDAYDLYVLYGNHKVRYTTYMQMTEAMLYYVRQGKKVVSVYYGHPGIFALSPHRALLLAKREGHKATMKPGVSALDCLCADLSIDPAHPGLQTHEATDMLIRRREPNTTLHVVLWQVGLIGEMGFRDQGYINKNFPVLIKYLQEFYGTDYPIIHYVASRYATISPTIETYRLHELYDPRIQSKITGISTFYISPKDAAPSDTQMLQKIGMLKLGTTVKSQPKNPLREIGNYGPREMMAFKDFQSFKIPSSYHYQTNNEASRFIIALQEDLQLQELFEKDPAKALSQFPHLTKTERILLATREANNMQAAAKGLTWRSSHNEKFLRDLFSNQKLITSLLKIVENTKSHTSLQGAFSSWAKEQTYQPEWKLLYKSFSRMCREWLLPWTGIYQMGDEYIITIQGSFSHPNRARIYVNGKNILKFSFHHGVLSWSTQPDVSFHGFLRLDVPLKGKRRLIGSIWEENIGTSTLSVSFANEVGLNDSPHYHLVGIYSRLSDEKQEQLIITPPNRQSKERSLVVRLNEKQLEGDIRYQSHFSLLSIGLHKFPLNLSPFDKRDSHQWNLEKKLFSYFYGSYVVNIPNTKQIHKITVKRDEILLDEVSLKIAYENCKQLKWEGGPKDHPVGSITFLIDPITLLPCLTGILQDGLGNSASCYGMVPDLSGTSVPISIEPLFSLPRHLWLDLLEQSRENSRIGGSFLWMNWCKVHRTIKTVKILLTHL